jgi:predicted RNase H-like nuclease (RuvC/YqgF family)
MKLPFRLRNAELENMNRILTDAARKKAERIKEVEDQVAQLEHQAAHLKQALESARKRESELEVAASQRAHLLNEKDKEIAALREVLTQRAPLAGLREALTKSSLRIQELENPLFKIAQK